MLSYVRLVARAASLVALTLVLLAVYGLGYRRGAAFRKRVVMTWHRGACWLAGLRIVAYGEPAAGAGHFFAANHVSYLDIVALGSVVEAAFVAKREVADWPAIGFLARLIGTIFIERAGRYAEMQVDALDRALAGGTSIVTFPEGTSTDGGDVKAFKSALFEAAIARQAALAPSRGGDLLVQPVAIAYCRDLRGAALAPEERACYPWIGDATLVPHLARVLMRPGAEVALYFQPAVPAAAFAGRKALAEYCCLISCRSTEACPAGTRCRRERRRR
jgi:1-acyl-sn-glycerol-3-phosphate acyltransferase